MQASNVSTLAFCPSPFSPRAAAPKQKPHKHVVWKLVYSDAAYPTAMTWWGQSLSSHLTAFEGRIWKQGCWSDCEQLDGFANAN